MKTANQSPWRDLVMWLRFYYAIHFLESGLNFVLFDYIPDFSRAGRAGPFQVQLAEVGLYQIVKYVEVVLGSMLLFNLAVPLALILMAGISFIILYLNLFISPNPRQLFTGTQELLLMGLLLLAYGGYYADFCRVRTRPYWFWDGFTGRGRPVPMRPQPSGAGDDAPPATRDFVRIVVVAAIVTVIVVYWSTGFGVRKLRLYDYGPPIAAASLTLVMMGWRRRNARSGS